MQEGFFQFPDFLSISQITKSDTDMDSKEKQSVKNSDSRVMTVICCGIFAFRISTDLEPSGKQIQQEYYWIKTNAKENILEIL